MIDQISSKLRPDKEEVLDNILEPKRMILPPLPPVHTNLSAKDRKLMTSEVSAVRKVAKNWAKHGHGFISRCKPDSVVRKTLKNINSAGISNKKRAKNSKPVLISNMGDNFDVNVMCHVEPQKNWDLVDDDLQYDQLFGRG